MKQYLQNLINAYEGEIAGEHYFRKLCDVFPKQRGFLMRCAELENKTAELILPLIGKYQLETKSKLTLQSEGAGYALLDSGKTWPQLIEESINSYPGYVDEFRTLEITAPNEDRPILEKLTEHELVLIEWMRANKSNN